MVAIVFCVCWCCLITDVFRPPELCPPPCPPLPHLPILAAPSSIPDSSIHDHNVNPGQDYLQNYNPHHTLASILGSFDPTIEYCWTTLIQIQMFILSSRETTYFIWPDISDISCMQKVQIYQIYPYLLHTSEATVTGVVFLVTSITVMLIYHTV